jgi:hypothetical protein
MRQEVGSREGSTVFISDRKQIRARNARGVIGRKLVGTGGGGGLQLELIITIMYQQ